ncbi:TetR/AcrR family transcriptional regulator [Nocardioides sp. zg-536]|uniref:TetR/AcrR family transcriptional regulator n=1 Tax=Nocardioides faecalis TaxID=2803858 RepID=A0A939BYK3_9ACTN|nr:TetR/AcrR family transcriptional regulator [Nocardioides faecalis]MBM9460030.1 TetR/AcrR family transcriptional regulator [Nocardioides faecalis]MBS4753102.1 TetR/AcrR family transcriptional regulator [Nocardioides faecalis]QVI58750.1 TetR/AcrR family transcriptional regulator [Nocardioides faecalis]
MQQERTTDSTRRYRGQAPEERVAERRARLLAAGLELFGTRGVAGTTVRAVVEDSGLAARYFYESFAGIEALERAVFDEIASEAATRALGALAAAGAEASRRERIRAVLAEMVDLMLEDPRKGRIALIESVSSPALGPRVLAESRRFAGLLAVTAAHGDPAVADPDALAETIGARVRMVARFLIGGVAHTLGAVLQGDIAVEREEVVDALVDVFDVVDAQLIAGTGARP